MMTGVELGTLMSEVRVDDVSTGAADVGCSHAWAGGSTTCQRNKLFRGNDESSHGT